MRPSIAFMGLALLVAPTVLAQGDEPAPLPELPQDSETASSATPSSSAAPESSSVTRAPSSSLENGEVTGLPQTTSTPSQNNGPSSTEDEPFHITNAPTIAGIGIPDQKVPDTAAAAFMQKSNLPDGTVFICVGALLGTMGAAVLLWRALIAWSLHRSVKRAALTQNLADLKAMSSVPGRKRGLYNAVGANSNMSLDRLSAAPPGTSRPPKPFASTQTSSTPPRSSTLFFSPTAPGGVAGNRDSTANRSSTFLPAGYYATGNAQPAGGALSTQVGGHGAHLSTHSLAMPGNRLSTRSGISPPGSPSLSPSSRAQERAPPSRDGHNMYNRNSVATIGTLGTARGGVYGNDQNNMSQLSLNVPGGTTVPGGRAPSAYLEDLFENHGSGPRERF